MEEVATMVTNNLTRPSVLLTAACAPSTLTPAVPVLAAAWAPISRVHQVQIQAELALTALVPTGGRSNGINGSTGFMGLGSSAGSTGSVDGNGSVVSNGSVNSDGSVNSKRYADERGIPPRGRPV
jgi:hypothetical protein